MGMRLEIRHSCRRRIRMVVAGIVAALPGVLPGCAQAQAEWQRDLHCTVHSPQPAIVSFNRLDVSRDTAIGAPISEEQQSVTTITCPQNTITGNGFGFRIQALPVRRVSGAVADVWETGVPGIGVRVFSAGQRRVISNSGVVELGTLWGRASSIITLTHRHQLVKTGPIGATGQLNFGNVYWFRDMHSRGRRAYIPTGPLGYVAIGTATLAPRSCRVTTPNVGVTLPNTQASTLRNNGASIGNTGFFIGLQCDTDTEVHITLTDATTPGNRTNLLSLTADSTARGVAVRVRRPDNAPVSFGPDSPAAGNANQWRVGQRSGATTIGMSAEYVATGDVTAGTVRALATFTMSYH